eukprot:TRINITY_DN2867_c0_g2_i3.p1 TRINITY_DN2867_c0_g2~~TRINITY_DN2867_c0_g2_i3.p1  ORF type:complete len:489 (-),score=77.99 TRINITY_DN2867_c0_g2_i3:315-1781(-)
MEQVIPVSHKRKREEDIPPMGIHNDFYSSHLMSPAMGQEGIPYEGSNFLPPNEEELMGGIPYGHENHMRMNGRMGVQGFDYPPNMQDFNSMQIKREPYPTQPAPPQAYDYEESADMEAPRTPPDIAGSYIDSEPLERPAKRQHLDPSVTSSPLEKLTSNQYLFMLRDMESELKAIRARIIQRNMNNIFNSLNQIRAQLDHFSEEFEMLKSTHFLRPGDFNNLLSLEEFLESTLMPQLSLYYLDCQQLKNPTSGTPQELAVHLAIVSQENAGPIFKEKPIGPLTLRLLTGATITQVQSGPVQPELAETSQRIKRNNQDIENSKQTFKENGTATFSDLKFASGTFPNLVRLKFHVTIQLVLNEHRITKVVESIPTKPYISMTNTGSQWKDAAGAWLKEECFKDAFDISIPRLWNYLQKHYLLATKQELGNIKRPFFIKDFDYLLIAKFRQGCDTKQSINQKEFQKLWDWIGPCFKKIRYQKYLLWMFENG